MPDNGLPPYSSSDWIAGGRAAEAAAPVAKRGAEILARLHAQLRALDEANARVLRADVPADEAAKLARALWSLRHETIPQAADLMHAMDTAINVYTPLLDSLLGDYWPSNPKTGEPLIPGYRAIAPPADAGDNASQS